MATSPILEIDGLLEPIPGDEAAGNAVPFPTRKQLDEHRKELLPEAFAPDDPTRPEQPKSADWPAIIKLAQQTLKETSKDMLVSARLTEAMTKEHGFAGLRDGLRLMRRLVEECWDRIHPSIEDGDLEVRAAAFNWLDDNDRGARFPYVIRGAGFLPADDRSLSWKDWRDIMDGKGELTKDNINQGSEALSREEIQDIVDDMNEGMAEADKIVEVLTEKMGDLSPGMMEVKNALRDCLQFATQILDKKGPPPAPEVEEEVASSDLVEVVDDGGSPQSITFSDNGGGGMVSAPRRANTRKEVYTQLSEISDRLMELDPHSPISYLVQRAVKLSLLWPR